VTAAAPYGVYDLFAWFYNQGWGSDYHRQAAPVFEDHVFPRLPAGARVLDVCCGTGDLTRVLVARGYRVTGIDGSDEMLRFARRQTPGAEFRRADARSFIFNSRFDAALSTYDSLNHILELAELENAFACVFDALVPGGLFVFDLNMQPAFETHWNGTFASVEESCAGITRGSYDACAKIGRVDLTLFQLAGTWHRTDVTVLEKCYSEEEVSGALDRAGFTAIEARDAWELGMHGDAAIGRVFFFAAKPLGSPSVAPQLQAAEQEEARRNQPAERDQPQPVVHEHAADAQQNKAGPDQDIPPAE
jgi:SAM-dependent methyltransferase